MKKSVIQKQSAAKKNERAAENPAASKLVFVSNVAAPLSKQQKKFNDLVLWIQQSKDEIEYMKDVFPQVAMRIEREIEGEKMKAALAAKAFYCGLDKQMDVVKIAQKDRAALIDYLVADIYGLCNYLKVVGEEYAELMAIHDKYAEEDFVTSKEMEAKIANDIFGEAFKTEFGEEVDFELDYERMESGDLEYILGVQQKMKEIQEKIGENLAKKQNEKVKTPKQIAKEEKEAEAKKKVEKNTRTIYFELAKRLHPDAIPDDAQKEWKTGLMQRLAVARDNDDLYEMLQIQIELQQSEDNALSKVGDEIMTHYIKVLKEQHERLSHEKVAMRNSFPGYADFFDVRKSTFSEQKFKTKLSQIKKQAANEIERIKYLKDPKWVKAFAKEIRREQEQSHDPFAEMMEFFSQI